jgi:protein-tyrosine phosphatase
MPQLSQRDYRDTVAERARKPTAGGGRARGQPVVLAVCTGNLCRSPLAEAMLARALASAGIRTEVASAGIAAPPGAAPDEKMQRVAAEHDVDLSTHRSEKLTREHLAAADLVLVMTRAHAREVAWLDRSALPRTVPLRIAAWKAGKLAGQPRPFDEWAAILAADVPLLGRPTLSTGDDIADPVGKSLKRYRAMADEVDTLVRALVATWGGG